MSGTEKIAVLEAGHNWQNKNRSPDGEYYEWEGAMDMCQKAELLLKQIKGIRVVQARQMFSFPTSLEGKVKLANDLGAHIYVSQHTNATASEWTTANGFGVYPHPTDDLKLSNIFIKHSSDILPMNSRGIRPTDFYVTRHTKMPAILLETGFHNNRDDLALLKTQEFRYLQGEVIARSVCEFLSVPYTIKSSLLYSAPMYYVVRGDNNWRIARDNGLSLEELESYNPHIPDMSLILAEFGGDVIFLGEPTELQTEYGSMRREYILLQNLEPKWQERIMVLEERLRIMDTTLEYHATLANKLISTASKLLSGK